jgi:hypothetical protein
MAAANGRAWNVARLEPALHEAMIGGQLFAEFFFENE